MREILFRGQRCDNGEWIFGFLVSENNIGNWVECHPVIPTTVGQFTGLTDMNGKKIFEGDFVKEQDVVHNGEIQIPGHIFSVVMRKGCWCVIPIYDTEEWDFLNGYLPFLEVIGNIHDNPELLGGAEH
jgi:uncharacterized phage protein (TIGR01671 family)